MGMYDSIYIDVICPHCGNEATTECQTKELDCELDHYFKGDYVIEKGQIMDSFLCLSLCHTCNGYFNVKVYLQEGMITGEYCTSKFKS